jgi:hypothetical protein
VQFPLNFVLPKSFRLSFTRLPDTSFYCQKVTLPGVTMGVADIPTPLMKVQLPGDRAVFNQLSVHVIATADLRNYEEMYRWLVGLSFPEDTDQFNTFIQQERERWHLRDQNSAETSDGMLELLDAHERTIRRFRFFDCFPVAIGDLDFDTQASDATPIAFPITFQYQLFVLEPKAVS